MYIVNDGKITNEQGEVIVNPSLLVDKECGTVLKTGGGAWVNAVYEKFTSADKSGVFKRCLCILELKGNAEDICTKLNGVYDRTFNSYSSLVKFLEP